MKTSLRVGTYAALVMLVLVIGAFAGWYMFLREASEETSAADSGRGFGTASPSFSGNVGSTYSNIAESVARTPSEAEAEGVPEMWHAVKTPIAGFGFVRIASSTKLYFVERATGYIFAADPITGTVTRLTNTLLPKTYEAYFSQNGLAILRRIGEDGQIETLSGGIGSATSSTIGAFAGKQLEKGIRSLAIDPGSRTIFYLLPDASGKTSGITAQWDGSAPKTILSSMISSWKPFLLEGRALIAERSEDGVAGHAYEISKDGTLTPLVRGVAGLTILPRNASGTMLYSSADGTALTLFSRTSAGTATTLSLATLAEKCAWAPGTILTAYCAVPREAPASNFLGNWYRGSAHTNDVWWRIDAERGTTEKYRVPENSDAPDVLDPIIDVTGRYIAFMDARDLSLWIMRLDK